MEPRGSGERAEQGGRGGEPADPPAGRPAAALPAAQPRPGPGGQGGAAPESALLQMHQERGPKRHEGRAVVERVAALRGRGRERAVPLQHEHGGGQVQPRQVGALRTRVQRGEVLQVDGGQQGGRQDPRARGHLPGRLHGEPLPRGVRARAAQCAAGARQRDPQVDRGELGAGRERGRRDLGLPAALATPDLWQECKW